MVTNDVMVSEFSLLYENSLNKLELAADGCAFNRVLNANAAIAKPTQTRNCHISPGRLAVLTYILRLR